MTSGASFVVDAVRTPFGRHGGALAGVRPDDLAATALRGLLDRHPSLDPARIDDIWFGDANAAGEDNRNVARMAALLAGLPTSVPGSTVNRLCGSGSRPSSAHPGLSRSETPRSRSPVASSR
jgi:acetyl-CoA acetyltransferase